MLDVNGGVSFGQYANLGEDSEPSSGTSPGTTTSDSCNGDMDSKYSCSVTESRSCLDLYLEGASTRKKRTVTCIGRVYGGVLNSTGIYTTGEIRAPLADVTAKNMNVTAKLTVANAVLLYQMNNTGCMQYMVSSVFSSGPYSGGSLVRVLPDKTPLGGLTLEASCSTRTTPGSSLYYLTCDSVSSTSYRSPIICPNKLVGRIMPV
jgi:hypothetical protein